MTNQNIAYQKLGKTGRRVVNWLAGPVTQVSLHLGPDHLLLAEKHYFKERYRRFYYRDIQAFILRKTASGKVTAAICFIAALLLLAIGLAIGETSAVIVFGILAFFPVLGAIANLVQGDSCKAYLKTAVQYEELPNLKFEKSAKKALSALRIKIVEAQGTTASPPSADAPAGPPVASPP